MRSQNRWTGIIVGVVMGVMFSAAFLLAGSLEPSVGPTAPGSQMYTLEQIYNRINNGVVATKMTTFTEPSSGPTAGTMHTLEEIYVLAGLRAPVPKTGQTQTVPLNPAPTGSDGALQRGVTRPNPRFTENNNGTVTDNLTGLIWLKNANCTDTVGEISKSSGTLTWADALTWCNNLASGTCNLSDNSTSGQWRLPNVKELQSLIDYAYFNPALSNAAGTGHWVGDPFINVQSSIYYWSSSSVAEATGNAWLVHMWHGMVAYGGKVANLYVWPVRSGQ